MDDPHRIFETARIQPVEWRQLSPACCPGSLLSVHSSGTKPLRTNKVLIFYPEVICQLHLFPAYVLGDKTKEGKQITTEAHLPGVRACHQQSSPAPSPGVPRNICLTFDLLLNMGFLPLDLSLPVPSPPLASHPSVTWCSLLNPAP